MQSGARAGTSAQRRKFEGPALFSFGFRPFFLGAAAFAGIAVPVWLAVFSGAIPSGSSQLDPLAWHAHEMIFGYLAAVVAGFLLTAIPNWTGRLPIMGLRLAGLFTLWLAGRIAMALALGGALSPLAAKLADGFFLVVLAAALAREIVVGRNWRNLPVVGLVSLMAAANLIMHFAENIGLDRMFAERLALGAAAMLIALIGGRVTPSFTRNWLAARGEKRLPEPFQNMDRAALAVTAAGILLWIVLPDQWVTGIVLLLASLANAVRLSRWRMLATLNEPLVTILHVGYGWLCFALGLLGASILFADWVPLAAALHALTAGAIGTMTLAMMTRASLGHTGWPLASTLAIDAIYMSVNAGAVLRVAAPWSGDAYLPVLVAGGVLWAAAFAGFAAAFARALTAHAVRP
ncbi:MAG: NnrS family protein [Proteobacteria bacterium]|nr:NnrS family protein [Pseudomonadota bacterium]